MNDREDIDAAAEALLAAAGPDRLRRFHERFDDMPDLTPAPVRQDMPTQTLKGTLLASVSKMRPDIEGMVRDAASQVKRPLTPEQTDGLRQQLAAFVDCEAFRAKIALLNATEPYSRLTERLEAADAGLRTQWMDFGLPVPSDELVKALASDSAPCHAVPLTGLPVFGKSVEFSWSLPLTPHKRKMLAALVQWIIDANALSRQVGSDAGRLWTEAYVTTMRHAGGPAATDDDIARPFPKGVASRLADLLQDAHNTLFADCVAIQRKRDLWGEK